MTEQRAAITRSLSDRAVAVVLVLLLALTLARAWTLIRPPLPLNGRGETSFSWAYRGAATGKVLRDTEPALRFGEILRIVVPASDPNYDPGWFRVMANYRWPHQSVLRVRAGPDPGNGRVTVVEFAGDGTARIRRPARSGNASP
jgi:hypothetical protein